MTSTADPGVGPGTTAAVILAAGGGSRFGGDGHKLLVQVAGKPVIRHVLDAVVGAGFDEVVVVTGAVDLESVVPEEVRVVHNQRWAEGMATSLQVGLAVAAHAGHDAIVVGLGDQPGVPTAAWRAVAAAASPIAVATYAGKRRNPVRLHRQVWSLLPTSGDEGARSLMRVRPDLVTEVPCQGDPADIDTLEDLDRWS